MTAPWGASSRMCTCAKKSMLCRVVCKFFVKLFLSKLLAQRTVFSLSPEDLDTCMSYPVYLHLLSPLNDCTLSRCHSSVGSSSSLGKILVVHDHCCCCSSDCYTPVHIMDLVVSQWITVCMRVVHEESIATNFFCYYV